MKAEYKKNGCNLIITINVNLLLLLMSFKFEFIEYELK